jgi:hypothetical protein
MNVKQRFRIGVFSTLSFFIIFLCSIILASQGYPLTYLFFVAGTSFLCTVFCIPYFFLDNSLGVKSYVD